MSNFNIWKRKISSRREMRQKAQSGVGENWNKTFKMLKNSYKERRTKENNYENRSKQ